MAASGRLRTRRDLGTPTNSGHRRTANSVLHDNGHRISEMNTLNCPDLSDIKHGDWVDRRLRQAWRSYTRLARLDRPVDIWLKLFPLLGGAHSGIARFS